MSLITDRFFYDALRNSADVIEVTEGRIFNTARPEIDEEEDKIPYVIIQNMGTQGQNISKDGDDADLDTITITVVAEKREGLGDMTTLIRETIEDEMDDAGMDCECCDDGYDIIEYSFSAGAVQYDGMKPCFFQELTWVVETNKQQ